MEKNLDEKIAKLEHWIRKKSGIVFFGGAGVSTESGIPDFRGKDGLYNLKYKYPPEEILSHDFFFNHTLEFFEFYRNKMNPLGYKPNAAHEILAEMERFNKLSAIVTQNIDGLHQRAGSKKVYELHGSVLRNYCVKCHKFYDADFVFNSTGIPTCTCGGLIKPDVVLYQEGLDDNIVMNSILSIENAEMLIVAGTSLTVQPAASLINYFRRRCCGQYLVIINKTPTPYDSIADLVIHESVGKVLKNARGNKRFS